ncbi:MAG: glycoside hydrolase family 2 TIM barrel-domain containing protein [Breznakibacter sp.]
MKKTIFFRFAVAMLLALFYLNDAWGQQEVKLTNGWQFVKCDLGGIWEAVRAPQAGQPSDFPMWQDVTVPHCYNATDAVDPDGKYYQGPAWYRIYLKDENPYPNGRTFLRFEGVGQKADVYAGLQKAGSHIGGYDAWEVDLTGALLQAKNDAYLSENYHGLIPVSVRCDNSRDLEMIPSNLSDFTLYGGLYRPVTLVYRPENWLALVNVQTLVDSKGKMGTVHIKPVNGTPDQQPVNYHITLVDGNGETIFSKVHPASADEIQLSVPKPVLWSPSLPGLYTLNVEARWDGHRHIISRKIGFRHFEFQKHGPFFLNGQRLLLKGTHRHEDFANVGAAETEEMLLAEMQMIKSMGANFIRLGHYQQSDKVLALCDSLGILVWEEIPWCRGGLGGDAYKRQARQMLQRMIGQHGSHPSVILWGLGNENDWPGDFESFSRDSIRTFMSELHQLAHKLDPTRLTAIRRCDFCKDIVDVYSPSIWPGWYRGRYTDYERVTQFEVQQTDRFLHAEWGGDSHAGRHSEQTDSIWLSEKNMVPNATSVLQQYSAGKNMSRNGDWSETYAAETFRLGTDPAKTNALAYGDCILDLQRFCHAHSARKPNSICEPERRGATRPYSKRDILRDTGALGR